MTKKMLQFVDVKQESPEKRDTSKRKGAGNSLLKLLLNVKGGSVCINLADTFVKKFNLKLDDIIVSNNSKIGYTAKNINILKQKNLNQVVKQIFKETD